MNIYYKTLHTYLKAPKKHYLIFFDECIEKFIYENFLGDQQYIILENFDFNYEDFGKCTIIDVENDKNKYLFVMKKIFNFENITSDYSENNVKNKKAIVFTLSETTDKYAKLYESLLLNREVIKNNYYISDMVIYDNKRVSFKYTNKLLKREFKETKRDTIALFIANGIGDYCIICSHLIEFVKKIKKIDVYVPHDYKCKILLKALFDKYDIDYNIICVQNMKIMEHIYESILKIGKYKNMYYALFVEYMFNNEFMHSLDQFKKQISFDEEIPPHKYSKDLVDCLINLLTNEEKEAIEKILKLKGKKVGLQFYTYEHGQHRSWGKDNVKEFCEIVDEEYVLINLTPYPIEKYDKYSFHDLGWLSIYAIFYLISKLDYVVGIDSCCGHIAAMFNKPNITLWNSQTPTYLYGDLLKVSFRTLVKNVSIVPKNMDINSIKGNFVFDILKKVDYNIIKLQENMITMKDSIQDKNVIYV